MRKFIDIVNLNEAPLADISTHGDSLDNEGSFSKGDRDYIKKAIVKNIYKQKLEKIPFDLYIYVINQNGLRALGAQYPEGEINFDGYSEDNKRMIPKDSNFILNNTKAIDEIKQIVEKRREKNPNAIHFIMGDNYSDDGTQVKPTSWILIHRLVHCLGNSKLRRMFNLSFETLDGSILKYILTTASARNNKLQSGEERVEMTTQYLLTGKIGINKEGLKKYCVETGMNFDGTLKTLERAIVEYQQQIDKLIKEIRGRVYYI